MTTFCIIAGSLLLWIVCASKLLLASLSGAKDIWCSTEVSATVLLTCSYSIRSALASGSVIVMLLANDGIESCDKLTLYAVLVGDWRLLGAMPSSCDAC